MIDYKMTQRSCHRPDADYFPKQHAPRCFILLVQQPFASSIILFIKEKHDISATVEIIMKSKLSV